MEDKDIYKVTDDDIIKGLSEVNKKLHKEINEQSAKIERLQEIITHYEFILNQLPENLVNDVKLQIGLDETDFDQNIIPEDKEDDWV